jgi:hypothetical protein
VTEKDDEIVEEDETVCESLRERDVESEAVTDNDADSDAETV